MLPTSLRPATRRPRHAAVLLIAALVASLVGVWGADDADATSYRFWSYWTGGADWTFASQGAARRPADGSVEGWRFAVSPATSSTIPPRHSPTFDSLCGKTSEQDGKKRVGLVVDFGVDADAPGGESPPAKIVTCAVVPEDATGYDVLMTVGAFRTDQGLICGINGYPATECGTAVADPTPTQSSDSGDTGSSGDTDGSEGGAAGGADAGAGAGDQRAGGASEGEKGDAQGGGKRDGSSERDDQEAQSAAPSPGETSDDTVAAAAATVPASPSSGSPLGLIVGLIVIAALAATALVLRRRRA